ncbi:MAG: 4'-phosphopantetheinyl transferase family protein [Nitrososphaerales archaeon]
MNTLIATESMSTQECDWSFPPSNIMLRKGDVHVWWASLDQMESNLGQLGGTLNTEELRRATRVTHGSRNKRFITSRGILRMILGSYLQVNPSELRFSFGKEGKPSLTKNFPEYPIQFNVAHSSGMVLYAFTLGRQVGVDLERIERIYQLEEIACRFLSNADRETISKFSGYKKYVTFFQIWTRKEAYLKARGKGLSDISIDIENISKDSHWSIRLLNPGPRFVGALVVEGSIERLKFWRYSEL